MRAQCRRHASAFAVLLAGSALLLLVGCGSGSGSGAGSGSGSTMQPQAEAQSLLVADNGNNRVLIFEAPWVTGQSATVVLGQVDFTSSAPKTMSTGLSGTANAITDAQGNAWVSDSQNSRVLQYKPPFTTGMAASTGPGELRNKRSFYDLEWTCVPAWNGLRQERKSLGC